MGFEVGSISSSLRCKMKRVSVLVALLGVASVASPAIADQVGSTECSGIRGDNINTRPIQKATLEPLQGGYKLRFTEMKQGKPIETVWELDSKLIIESAKTGTAPEGRWNLTSYNRQPPVTIEPGGNFKISMMVTSRSVCTFAGKLQFLGDAQAQLFPGSAAPGKKSSKRSAAIGKIAEGRYWVGATGMVIEVRGQKYQFRDEESQTAWKPISELTYIKDGVFKAAQTYWCLSKRDLHRSEVCTEKGWVRK